MTDGSDDEQGSDTTPSESVEEAADQSSQDPAAADGSRFDDTDSIDSTDSDSDDTAEPSESGETDTTPSADANGDLPGGRTIEGPLGPADASGSETTNGDDATSNGATGTDDAGGRSTADDETSTDDAGGLSRADDETSTDDAGGLSRADDETSTDDAGGLSRADDETSTDDVPSDGDEADAVPDVYGGAESDDDGKYTADDFQTDLPDTSAHWSEDDYDAPTPGTEPGDGPPNDADAPDVTEPSDGERAVPDGATPSVDSEAIADGAAPGSAAEAGMAATEAATGRAEATATAETGAPTGAGGTAGTGTDDGAFEGPESDEEMPLTDHIEEMMRRLSVVVAVGSVVSLGVLLAGIGIQFFPSAEEIIVFLWDHHVNFQEYRPYVYGPLEFLLTKLKVAGLAGVVVSLPVFVYETYRFMRPGLYPNERRYYLAAVPTSLVLALVGVAFTHFIVLPAIFQYFISYTAGSAQLAFGLRETFNLILLMMGYMAIVFQIPLFIQLAIMMGLVTRRWLEQRRLLFWGSFLGLSFLVSPDPTGMAPIIVTATMITLFEGTLMLIRWTDR